MKTIPLVNSDRVALVDDEDYDYLSQFRWHDADGYAIRYQHGAGETVRMHREITEAKPRQVVDHKDRNGLNNQRANLRITDQHGNLANAGKHCDAVHSKYKGVSRNHTTSRWVASIGVDYQVIPLGTFATEHAAALAYNAAAVKYFGEFARINDVPPEPPLHDVPVLPRPTTSAYRGVCWNKRQAGWRAQIKVHGRNHFLGTFDTEEAAARSYDAAARRLHGEKARLNFPDD